jgi:hypothetical protein
MPDRVAPMKKTILSLVVASTLALIPSANAFEQVIATMSNTATNAVVHAEFQVEHELGRAWINTSVVDLGSPSDGRPIFEDEIFVQHLTYDDSTQEVIYTGATGAATECAFVKHKRVLGYEYDVMKNTGNCEISLRENTCSVDNGTRVHREHILEVVLSVD